MALLFLLASFLVANASPLLSNIMTRNSTDDFPPPGEVAVIAHEAYIYGFPRLLMERTYLQSTGPLRPVNTFSHATSIPDHTFRAVVRPNVDTLYSTSFLDLSPGPICLQIPAELDRYNLMGLYDAWSNNFAGPRSTHLPIGSETSTETLQFVIAGPHNSDLDPGPGATLIAAPTNLLWLIGRTQVRGDEDVDAALGVMAQYALTPFDITTGSCPHVPPSPIPSPPSSSPPSLPNPEDIVKALPPLVFFNQLSSLMTASQPLPTADSSIISRLATIGIGPDASFPPSALPPVSIAALSTGANTAQALLDAALQGGSGGENEDQEFWWAPDPASNIPIGVYGTNYFIRAYISQSGFGANTKDISVYLSITTAAAAGASSPSDRVTLSGANGQAFTLTFPVSQETGQANVPVKDFWSVTVYDREGFLTENEIGRYALGSSSPLVPTEEGGTVTLYMAREKPEGVAEANWLPVPEAQFNLMMRMYGPEESVLDGTWRAPDVIAVQGGGE